MLWKIIAVILLIGSIGAAQELEIVSVADEMLQTTASTVVPTDSVLIDESYRNTNFFNDALSPQQRFEENPKFNVRHYNYKQQVIVGGVVMFCVTLAMVANNNYNPKTLRP